MSQIQAGKAVVHNGSVTVTCSDPTVSWASVRNGNQFSVFQSNLFYNIVQANAPNAPGAPWTLTLQTPFSEADQLAGINYVIVQDFSHYLGLPLPDARSSKLNVMVARIVQMIDVLIFQVQTTLSTLSGTNAYYGFVPDVSHFVDFLALPAATIPTNAVRFFVNADLGGKLDYYQLRAGVDVTNIADGVGRPSDYGGANNTRCWYGVA